MQTYNLHQHHILCYHSIFWTLKHLNDNIVSEHYNNYITTSEQTSSLAFMKPQSPQKEEGEAKVGWMAQLMLCFQQ